MFYDSSYFEWLALQQWTDRNFSTPSDKGNKLRILWVYRRKDRFENKKKKIKRIALNRFQVDGQRVTWRRDLAGCILIRIFFFFFGYYFLITYSRMNFSRHYLIKKFFFIKILSFLQQFLDVVNIYIINDCWKNIYYYYKHITWSGYLKNKK